MIVQEKKAADFLCCGPDGCGILVPASGDAIIPGHVSVRRVCAGAKCMAWVWNVLPIDIGRKRVERPAPTEGMCCYRLGRPA